MSNVTYQSNELRIMVCPMISKKEVYRETCTNYAEYI